MTEKCEVQVSGVIATVYSSIATPIEVVAVYYGCRCRPVKAKHSVIFFYPLFFDTRECLKYVEKVAVQFL